MAFLTSFFLNRNNRGCGGEPRPSRPARQRGVAAQPGEGGLQAPWADQAGAGGAHPEGGAGLPDTLPGAAQHQDPAEGQLHTRPQAEGAGRR